jgi:O-antigen ligase
VALRCRREKRCVPYHPVVYRPPLAYPPLDPLWLIIFTALFVACALLTRRRASYGAALLVFVVPFAAAHAVLGTTATLQKVVLLGVVAGLTATPSAWNVLRRGPSAGIIIGFVAIVAANLLTIFVAQYRLAVIVETLKWSEYLLFFATLVVAYAADPAPRIVRTAFFASILVTLASAFLDIFTGATFGLWINGVAVPRIAGTLEGPNQFGGYLEAAVAALGAWQIRAPNRFNGLLLFLAGVALVLTFSRAAILCTAIIVVVFAISERARLVHLWPLAVGFAGGAINDLLWASGAAGAIVSRETDVSVVSSGGLGDRGALWRAARFFFLHDPLLGIGAGNYEHELASAGVFGVRTQANNWYLQAAAEGGIVLLGATLAWIVAVVRACVATVRRSPWGLAAAAASAAFVIHGFIDDLMFYPKVAESWIALIALAMI